MKGFNFKLIMRLGIFFALIIFYSHPSLANPPKDSLRPQLIRLAYQATQKRTGVLLWMDRQTKILEVYGDASLAEQSFRPGSLFKILTAEAAVQKGLLFNYRCTGHDRIAGQLQYCWDTRGHGALDLPRALALSCNLFFSQLGLRLGRESLQKTIESYPELVNDWPLNPQHLSERDLAKLAIGDSPLFKTTPRRVAIFWNHFLEKLTDPVYAPILQGLRRSVQEGTASRHVKKNFDVLAKTGTSDSEDSGYKTDAWFLGAYPANQPRFAFVIFLKRGHGYEEASALAEKIFKVLVESKVE